MKTRNKQEAILLNISRGNGMSARVQLSSLSEEEAWSMIEFLRGTRQRVEIVLEDFSKLQEEGHAAQS